jgi:hypothetical protein
MYEIFVRVTIDTHIQTCPCPNPTPVEHQCNRCGNVVKLGDHRQSKTDKCEMLEANTVPAQSSMSYVILKKLSCNLGGPANRLPEVWSI